MKKVIAGFLIAAAALGVFVMGRRTAKWSEFRCQECGFSVSMPGKPGKEAVTANGGPLVGTFTTTMYSSYPWFRLAGTEYGVTYFDMPSRGPKGEPLQFDPEKAYAGAKEGALQSVNGKLIAEADCILSGLPAKEVVVEGQKFGKRATVVSRLLFNRGRLWVLVLAHPVGKDYSSQRVAFFDSFALLE
ncbi:MAG: hypothetical protein HYZ28_00695 [Myxococcales bacterium]|nr:hypothetical protein [Myxococcales bacterium]